MAKRYSVQYIKKGMSSPTVRHISANSAAEARAKFRMSHPGAEILEVWEG